MMHGCLSAGALAVCIEINLFDLLTDCVLDCIGLHLAMMELRLATASFFRKFTNASVSSREGFTDDDMAPKAYLLVYPKGKRCLIDGS